MEKMNETQQQQNEFSAPVQEMVQTTKEYLDIRIQEAELNVAEGLSNGFGKILAAVIIMELLVVGLTIIAAALIILIGKAMGNYVAAAFIIAGVFAILPIIVFCCRKALFIRPFEKIFTSVFFGDKQIEDMRIAKAQIRNERMFKEQELSMRARYMQAFYSPGNLFKVLFRKASIVSHITKLAAEVYNKVRSGMSESKKNGQKDKEVQISENE